jgi:4-amino-4-deoxy-L-arabinose transferase-like glycosyltransferase
MRSLTWQDKATLFLFAVICLMYFAGVPAVPFHPDESTQLYTSSDLITIFTDPLSLGWQPSLSGDLHQRYRELDAPLTRYLIGVGRSIAGLPALPVDWNWSLSWQANQAAGALPDESLLLAGRYAIAALFPFTLLLIYWSARTLGSKGYAALSALFLAGNALVLLHTRRAMAEGALIFGVALFLWSLLRHADKAWLVGLAAAVAFNAKQSALALFPIGLIAVLMWKNPSISPLKRYILRPTIYLGVFLAVTFVLNPFLWSNPLQAAADAIHARQIFTGQQISTLTQLLPQQVVSSPGERTLALMANAFITQPAIADVGNYLSQTAASQAHYLANPLNNLMRGMVGGGIMLILTLFGLAILLINNFRLSATRRRDWALFSLAFALQAAALIAAFSIPIQRYVMPLIPFLCLIAAAGLEKILQGIGQAFRMARARQASS